MRVSIYRLMDSIIEAIEEHGRECRGCDDIDRMLVREMQLINTLIVSGDYRYAFRLSGIMLDGLRLSESICDEHIGINGRLEELHSRLLELAGMGQAEALKQIGLFEEADPGAGMALFSF